MNESSVVLSAVVRAPTGALRLLALGDLETEGQAALLRSGRDVLAAVDVVKVAHHGSARQVPDLYARLAPRVALVGVGADNGYGHPAPSALTMLRRTGAQVFRTDRDGDIALAATGQGTLRVAARGP